MPISGFIKENFVLVLGLTLPILLIGLFFVFSILPAQFATPPKYDLIVSTSEYYRDTTFPVNTAAIVEDGVLKIRMTPLQNKNPSKRKIHLYRYSVDSKKIEPIDFDLPNDIGTLQKTEDFIVPATRHIQLDDSIIAPDGYEFDNTYRYRNGLFSDVFWGRSYRKGARLKKGMSAITLPPLKGKNHAYIYARHIDFVGWVIKEGDAQ